MSLKLKSKVIKSIYVYSEAILYGVLIMLTIFLNTYGPLFLKFIPLVLILGIIGRIIFDRPIVTSLFGFCVSLCEIEILSNISLEKNIIYSMYTFFCILLGEIAGVCIFNIFTSKAKKLSNKMAKEISLLVLTTFIGVFLNKYLNGDPISYIKSRNILDDYVSKNYGILDENVKIEKAVYVCGTSNYFSFTLSGLDNKEGKNYSIGVYSNKKVIDGYYDSKLNDMTEALKDKFDFKFSKENFGEIKLSIYYTNLEKDIVLNIEKNVDTISDTNIANFAKEANLVLDKIKEFDEFDNIYKINLVLKAGLDVATGEIKKDEFFDENKYIEKFNIEYFDI